MPKKFLKKLTEAVPEYIGPNEQYVLVFLDESSPQTRANTQRLWSFKQPMMIKNTDYIKANTFVFYSVNCNNFIDFMELTKAESFCKFLEEIVGNNQKKRIILILDNSKSRHADKTLRKERELKITLVFLPPYSPDLNHVEFVWKTIKREVSVRFIQSKEQMKNIIKNEFKRIAASLSFATKWMETFNTQIKSVLY